MCENCRIALRAYNSAAAEAWQAYDRAVRPALEAYEGIDAQSLPLAKKKKTSEWKAYFEAEAAAWEARQKVVAPALSAYLAAKASCKDRIKAVQDAGPELAGNSHLPASARKEEGSHG